MSRVRHSCCISDSCRKSWARRWYFRGALCAFFFGYSSTVWCCVGRRAGLRDFRPVATRFRSPLHAQVLPFSLKVFGAQSRQLLLRAMQVSQSRLGWRPGCNFSSVGGRKRFRSRALRCPMFASFEVSLFLLLARGAAVRWLASRPATFSVVCWRHS